MIWLKYEDTYIHNNVAFEICLYLHMYIDT